MVRVLSLCAASVGPQSCPVVCSCSNQFSKVVCTRRGLTKVPSGIPSNTRYLNLMENSIEMIQADTFRHLHHMERLQLGRNAIRQIEVGAFNGLTSLNTLELFDNRLTVIPSGAFEYLSKLLGLEELEISENHFPEIKPGSFRGLKSLKKLWIMNSQISLIERNAFDDVTALMELNLAHNNLSSLPHDLFTPLREYIPTNSTCCGRCHSPAHMRGRYLVEVDQTTFQCSAPFIVDAPRDLNISAERVAELKCRTAPMSSVRWLLPNGTVLTHGSNHPRISVLNDGTLNFSNVLPSDTGIYTCMVTNVAGNSNASAYLNVSNAELNTSNLSYFTTVTVEVVEPPSEETPKPKMVTASPSVFQPVFISTPTVLLENTKTPEQVSVPTTKGTEKPPTSLDEVMKTTKIIIGCFVAVTLLAAVMLIAFYKLRKRHQQRSTVAATRTIEIIQVDEDMGRAASATSIPGEGAVVLSTIRDHNNTYNTYKANYNTYKPAHGSHWTGNNISNSLHRPRPRPITTIPEHYITKTQKKEKRCALNDKHGSILGGHQMKAFIAKKSNDPTQKLQENKNYVAWGRKKK
ncbi:leucine-rich repeat-containing protein 4-like [Scleropages formosus]|uniref:Leucine-rich repeat-containing protein 4-like n=1 Tax=Scleropages formosus TaxID=113540 RepID=A0A0P7ZC37_SCLFO|nr:leucine-rich repeat-containing protein 4-like [Scleropages formosus]